MFFQLSLEHLPKEDREKILRKKKEAVPSAQRVLLTRAATLDNVTQLPKHEEKKEEEAAPVVTETVQDLVPAEGAPIATDPSGASGGVSGSSPERRHRLTHSPSQTRSSRGWRRKASQHESDKRVQSINGRNWVVETTDQGNGGLRNAVYAALNEGDMQDRVWVGTLGIPTEGVNAETKQEIKEVLADKFDSIVVYSDDKDFHGHYAKYCKEILWP